MEDYFFWMAETIGAGIAGREAYAASFSGEDSDFVRFNESAVRQAGSVAQRALTLDLIEGERHAVGTIGLSGVPATDRERIASLTERLREIRSQLPEDPFLLYSTDGPGSARRAPRRLPEEGSVLDQVAWAGRNRDLVGIYAAGGTYAGFANSFGQRNWYENYSFHLDWSFHRDGDRAVKAAYAGLQWSPEEFDQRVRTAAEELRALGREPRAIPPGKYRVYLTPAAFYEIAQLLGWGSFGLRAHRTKTTPLLRMVEEGACLDPSVRLSENIGDGIAPDFQEAGFCRPDEVVLVEGGSYANCLVSPRSAREFGEPTNGASAAEMPTSMDIGAGEIAAEEALQTLGSGLYVSNLWYLNFSDRAACRTTGMTRFATFRVEHGAIQEPVVAMRFDETLFRMLGSCLIGLTRERELMVDPGSYGQRSTDSARLPGALIEDFTFTL